MKIAMVQCNTVAGDVTGNAGRIAAAVREAAARGAGLCVTPELALSGVNPRNLLFSQGFLEGCHQQLQQLAQSLEEAPPVLVGTPVASSSGEGKLASNAAVLLHRGNTRLVSRKVFSSSDSDARYFARGVSCGVLTLEGWRLGVVLCEDGGDDPFWKIQHANAHNPLMELVSRGVDAIVQMAAVPFVLGGQSTREHMLSHVAARHHVHLFSVNLVGGNDERIYPGKSLAFGPTGGLITRGKAFEEDIVLVDCTSQTADSPVAGRPSCAEEACWKSLVLGTRDYVHKSGASRAVLGLSGGIDSALVAAIAREALGAGQVRGVLLPSPYTSAASVHLAEAVAASLGISTVTVAIEPLMQGFARSLEGVLPPAMPGDVTFENLQARIRAVLLMALANREKALLLNTGNKSEAAMGYSTLYGDSAGALAVIGDLTKTMVYRLARWYNEHYPERGIPQEILDRPPTAELRPGQLDTDSLPPYSLLDPLVETLMNPLAGENALNEILPGDMESEARTALLDSIYTRLCNAEFKRRQEAPALQVTQRPFSATGWIIPMSGQRRWPR